MQQFSRTFLALCVAGGLNSVAIAQDQSLLWPLQQHRVTGEFNGAPPSGDTTKHHTGVDLASSNVNVLAPADGIVVATQRSSSSDHGLGNAFILQHYRRDGSPFFSLYAHLAERPQLTQGQCVSQSQIIANYGGTYFGDPNGVAPHLHWEIKIGGIFENPTGNGPFWGYTTPNVAEQHGYLSPRDNVGITVARICVPVRDITNSVQRDSRFRPETLNSFYPYADWDPNWKLTAMNVVFQSNGCRCSASVWVYQITYLQDHSFRYTIFLDPDTNAWSGWTRVQ